MKYGNYSRKDLALFLVFSSVLASRVLYSGLCFGSFLDSPLFKLLYHCDCIV